DFAERRRRAPPCAPLCRRAFRASGRSGQTTAGAGLRRRRRHLARPRAAGRRPRTGCRHAGAETLSQPARPRALAVLRPVAAGRGHRRRLPADRVLGFDGPLAWHDHTRPYQRAGMVQDTHPCGDRTWQCCPGATSGGHVRVPGDTPAHYLAMAAAGDPAAGADGPALPGAFPRTRTTRRLAGSWRGHVGASSAELGRNLALVAGPAAANLPAGLLALSEQNDRQLTDAASKLETASLR